MARRTENPKVSMMVNWPYDEIPELYTEVTLEGRKIGKVVGINQTARSCELELLVDADLLGTLMDPGEFGRPR